MTDYVEIVLRPLKTPSVEDPRFLGPVVTHFYPGVGYLTPIVHSRTKLWHVSREQPKLASDLWVDPATISECGYKTKRDALAVLAGEDRVPEWSPRGWNKR